MTSLIHDSERRGFHPARSPGSSARPAIPAGCASHPLTVLAGAGPDSLLDVVIEAAIGRITLYGGLDLGTCQLFVDAVRALIAFDPTEVTVDTAGLTVIDATGIGLLVGFRNDLAQPERRDRHAAPAALAATRPC